MSSLGSMNAVASSSTRIGASLISACDRDALAFSNLEELPPASQKGSQIHLCLSANFTVRSSSARLLMSVAPRVRVLRSQNCSIKEEIVLGHKLTRPANSVKGMSGARQFRMRIAPDPASQNQSNELLAIVDFPEPLGPTEHEVPRAPSREIPGVPLRWNMRTDVNE